MSVSLAYFDTSVMVKRYFNETGSRQARSLLGAHRFLSSAICSLEALSAIKRRFAAGDISLEQYNGTVNRLKRDRSYWELIEVSPLVLDRAEELIVGCNIRTLDAIHVASALIFKSLTGKKIPFITADAVQREAALGTEALKVVWVGEY